MAEERKYQTPRGAAANKAKSKYKTANYDRGELALPKGMKAAVQAAAAGQAMSFNEYVKTAIMEKYKRDTGEEMKWNTEKLGGKEND